MNAPVRWVYVPDGPPSPAVSFFNTHPLAKIGMTLALAVYLLGSLAVRFVGSVAGAGVIAVGVAAVLGVVR